MNEPKSTFLAEIICRRLKGKYVEVYSGDTSLTRLYSDSNVMMKDVVRGQVHDAEGELLILLVKDSDVGSQNLVYINAWNIRAVVEPQNRLSITDLYEGEHDKVKK